MWLTECLNRLGQSTYEATVGKISCRLYVELTWGQNDLQTKQSRTVPKNVAHGMAHDASVSHHPVLG